MVKSPYVPSKFIVDPNWPSKVKPITAHNPTRDPKIVRLSLMCVLLTQNVLCSWIPTFNLESTFLLVWSISYFIPHNWHYSSKSLCLPTWLTSHFCESQLSQSFPGRVFCVAHQGKERCYQAHFAVLTALVLGILDNLLNNVQNIPVISCYIHANR